MRLSIVGAGVPGCNTAQPTAASGLPEKSPRKSERDALVTFKRGEKTEVALIIIL